MAQKSSKNVPALTSKGIVIEKLNILIEPLRARHERHYKDSYFHFWADILLVATLVGLAVTLLWLLVWQPKPDFVLEARLETSQILSGQSEEFVIHYSNEEGHPIEAATLAVVFPDHFSFESAQPAALFDEGTSTFHLGDLGPHDKGEVRIKGLIRGGIDERQNLGLNLSYRHGEIKKQVLDSFIYHIDGSVIDTSLIEMPETAYRTVDFNGVIEIRNNGRSPLNGALLAFPADEWDIRLEAGELRDGRFELPTLEAGESERLTFTAVTASPSATYDFTVESYLAVESRALLQQTVNRSIAVAEPSLGVSASFREQALSGPTATLDLSFTNNDQSEISDLSFAIESRRESLAVTGLASTSQRVSVANNVVKYETPLPPGSRGSLSATVSLERRTTVFNDFADLSIRVSYKRGEKEYAYAVASPKLRINSNLTLSSGGYYYGPQGDQLGIGPVPPKVGIPTTYWIIWEANNLGNEVEGFEVSADLPANVVWVDQQSVVEGEISYSPVGRRVLWKIDRLSQTGGNYRASFAVSLVPREEDFGSVPNLLTNIIFRGSDVYTGAIISRTAPSITANIESDRHSAGKGKVERLE